MAHNHTARRVALGLLLAGIAIPVAAQEAQPVTPPAVPPPAAEAAAPAPVEAATPAPPAAAPTIQFAPQSPVVQTQPPPAPPPESVRVPAERQTRTVARAAPTRAPVAVAPVVVAPATVTPAPAAEAAPVTAPEAALPAPVAEEPVAPAPTAEATTTTETTASNTVMWGPIVIGALILLGLIGFLFARRRRAAAEQVYYEEPGYEPIAAAPAAAYVEERAPVAAAPLELDDSGRPWIDVGLRPIRADANDEAAQVELELTVSNSGDKAAKDVRVSTWMLADARSSDNEQALIDARTHANTTAFDLPAGADRSVDTTLGIPRGAVNGSFRPLVVAEATYPLPDGTEGRIAATFEIGEGDEIRPIATDGVHENLGARLHEIMERS